MVKLKGPLFSLEASGSLAGALTYQTIYRQPVVKSLRFTTYIRSPAQDAVRDTFSGSSEQFFELHGVKQDSWDGFTDAKGLTGYKSFMNQFLRRTYLAIWQFELPPDLGFCITGNHNVDDFLVGGGFITVN